ncbi:MAG: rod shape-determining protein RodA [Limnospira sp. PMC 1291.21]|uniref:Peptidoglycan glycosyltransferase RodA n=2 Tax=Limnospira TaxID=2596745 RepID=A0A9P1KFT3_9CYAN|nr:MULTISPECIES: rod shape-determining protein RodA [Limnospira]MBD2668046.1 rod shape-determining protein RodA [Arthrospira platensis FACHB-439]QJB26439.1 rod shape-determining protein RodA [Limnospira fusiformis SAG 85.79]EDZ92708.1 rod shape-determining protein RodA [Limnospira maxima CS-328]MDT9177715.1 rod shape-determining protein RodA [Limnospira sp. PMC 1238.20]MDT9186427.1 rod shape-determining protein RodA [Limnospira sp. PMC 894.15]
MFFRARLKSYRRSPLAAWAEVDWLLLVACVALTGLGGIMIRSVEVTQGLTDWWQHWITGGVGLILAMIIAKSNYQTLINWKWIVYIIVNLSLIAVQLIGTTALGAQRWINIGGFHVQPSEFAKVGIIIVLAALLHEVKIPSIPDTIKMLIIAAVPWGLVLIEPNLGTSLVFGMITLGMLYWGNVHPGWLILLLSPIISAILTTVYQPAGIIWAVAMGFVGWWSLPWRYVTGPLALGMNLGAGKLGDIFWGFLQDYQKQRLIGFLNPEQDPLGAGYHLIQSRIAIGSGQLYGRGLYQGTQTQLDFIPEQHTDFIFSAIGEELGFIGCIIVLAVFWIICLRLVIIAQTAKDSFGSLIAIGVLSMLMFQVFVNIGMNIGLAPVTGIPLPFLSYGRSALLSNFLAMGLVESVANHRQRKRIF